MARIPFNSLGLTVKPAVVDTDSRTVSCDNINEPLSLDQNKGHIINFVGPVQFNCE